MLWYLILGLCFTSLNVACHMLWLTNADTDEICGSPSEDQDTFGGIPHAVAYHAQRLSEKVLWQIKHPHWSVKWILLAIEIAIVIFGILIVFVKGRDSEGFCEPAVWWTAAGLATFSLIMLVFAALGACLFSTFRRLMRIWLFKEMVLSFRLSQAYSTRDDPLPPEPKTMIL
eukprot:gnl/TRDRNA2_/TRDRNA2_180161_c0_seq1.p2 gnl/TRDRNA2_/TRDRNA2_180161_c0~~gnl/TRDRNA2_/TRDRNA2_180161_c0_seq1.p2  ORF type:complete len:193 (-),score=28.89 gnl/TRDRNA2_/TRDRNA2_180161_c0_seq1:232-747(-)